MTTDDEGAAPYIGPLAERLLPALSAIAALFLAAAVVVTTIQVFSRFALNRPFSWAEEIGRYLFVWSVYAGFLVAIVRGTHIRVDALSTKFSPRWARLVSTMIRIISVATFAYVAYLGFGLAQSNVSRQFYTVPGLSMAWLYAAVPVAMTCAALFLLVEPFASGLFRDRAGDGKD